MVDPRRGLRCAWGWAINVDAGTVTSRVAFNDSILHIRAIHIQIKRATFESSLVETEGVGMKGGLSIASIKRATASTRALVALDGVGIEDGVAAIEIDTSAVFAGNVG